MPKSRKPYRILESRSIYRGRIVELVKDKFTHRDLPGKTLSRVTLVHPGAVVILPFVDRSRILLLRQFRYAAKGELWEIPAGTLERGENPLFCARRELEEETGFRAKKWKRLTSFYCAPGISDEKMTLYRAEGLVPGRKNLDHDEILVHKTFSLKEAARMARSGAIRDGKTLAALLWALHFDR